MEKFISKISASLTLIAFIFILMGTQNKDLTNEKWMISSSSGENGQELILKMNTGNGDVYRWDKKALKRFEGRWVKLVEVR